jgi:hypothetical protein
VDVSGTAKDQKRLLFAGLWSFINPQAVSCASLGAILADL